MSILSILRPVASRVVSQPVTSQGAGPGRPGSRGLGVRFAGPVRRAALAAALGLAAIGGAAEAQSQPATMSPVAPGTPRLELPRLEDGRRVALPPMVIPEDPPGPDRRPIYIGAGLIVLGAAFWWNRRQRDRFEREDGVRQGRAGSVRRPRRDDDADDLHAAARGDASERPDPPHEQGPS